MSRLPGRWLAPDETVSIAGFRIDSGMFYVGGVLPARHGRNDNCLVDPCKPIASTTSDYHGETMSYWPAYGDISPSARRAYLEWLSGGRCDPDAYIGYVFLFFYGLERRLFVDARRDEAPVLAAEVSRLLAIYGHNRSFEGYARRFLEAAALLGADPPTPQADPTARADFEIPINVRVHLGRRLEGGAPFGPEETLLWVLALPDTYPRTPVVRCFAEFQNLWRLRFLERYPDGLTVRAPKARLKAQYRPASACFDAHLDLGNLPDIAAVQGPLEGLRDLLSACTDELDPYSRLIGRRPEAKDSVEALLLLPPALAWSQASAAMAKLDAALEAGFAGGDTAVMPTRDLLSLLGLSVGVSDRLSASEGRQLGVLLDRLDIGFEPDRRYGPLSPSADGPVALFRASAGAPTDPERPDLAAARTLVEVAVLAAHADGVVVPAEVEAIRADLETMAELAPTERQRLFALALVLLSDPPRHQAAIQRLTKLPPVARRQATSAAVSAVLADAHVAPAEVHFLERLHKALGLSTNEVYIALHRAGSNADEPARVTHEQRTPGTPIPPEAQESDVVALDEERLARIRKETSAVSELLAGIFVDEAAPATPVAAAAQSGLATPQASRARFNGLDAAHADLLLAVLGEAGLGRDAFEAEARALKLFPEGALETINDWGFDLFDEPVLEADNRVIAVEHLRGRLQEMGASA